MKVRQAINYAINKKDIVDSLTYGNEEVAYSLFPKEAPYCDTNYEIQYKYDIDKANQLLDEAGWSLNASTEIREKDGLPLKLQYVYWSDLSLAKETALAIKTQLKKVGIEVETIEKDQMSWWREKSSRVCSRVMVKICSSVSTSKIGRASCRERV